MHYLEDYLEIIEFLPAELKLRFQQIKELDEHVQSQLDSLNDRSKTFFTLCRKNSKPELRDQQYQNLCKEYDKMLKDSEEKIRLSNHIHDLLDRHLRRVDQDLSRFTIELEADTAGITEILEQKSYQLDRPPTPEKPVLGQKRNRQTPLLHDDLINGEFDDYSPSPSARASPAPIPRMKYSRREKDRLSVLRFPTPDLDSDAVLDLDEHFTPSALYAGTGGKPPMAFSLSETKPPRKRSVVVNQPSPIFTESVLPPSEPSEWMVDPNEPRYCLCNQVSYGEMVGCDNAECTIEWFHYGCVGISEPPKGKWYCPHCSVMKKKSSRKNY